MFNADYSFAITAPAGVTPNHLSIANDGTLTIGSAIEVPHGGTYTVTATGQGNYSGRVSATFTLTVAETQSFVHLAGGTFQMGSTDSEAAAHENPVHTSAVDSFSMAETEVTHE